MHKANAKSLRERLDSWFPDREFFMRSQGHVRFIKLSARVQKAGAGVLATAMVAWLATMGTMAVTQYTAQRDRLALLEREAKVETAESRVDRYRDDIDAVQEDLARRQTFLEEMVEGLPDDVKVSGTVSDSSSEAAETVSKVSAAIPEAAELAKLEARQLAFVERLTRYADARAERATAAIRELGLNPDRMLADAQIGIGGPLELLSTNRDGSIDPRFERLGLSLARMEALERSLDGIPQVLPASRNSMSSGFGLRRDPFTGRAAMHSGLDFRGAYGSPIYAAAKGRVVFAGRKSGYGRVVDIDHGNGLMTRYAHMSALSAKAGQLVEPGDVVGKLGSSGRSTGPHLHFEVRIKGRAVNPRPFLEKAPHVLEKARTANADHSH